MSASLAEQQQAMLAALWAPRHADAMQNIANFLEPIGAAGLEQSERGLKAYRSNGHELAQRALAAAFPVVAELMGPENFEGLARHFWQGHPPQRGDLAQWGGDFPAFIESLPDLSAGEPYLADVARVEWALHAAATAADAQVDTASFNLMATQDPERITLVLAPGTVCIASRFPVAAIINAHRIGEPTLQEAGLLLREGVAQTALVWRQGLKPSLRLAAPGEAAFAAALQENRSLADSLACAPDFDFNAWLAPSVQSGLLLAAREL
jgi:hypothetical protein